MRPANATTCDSKKSPSSKKSALKSSDSQTVQPYYQAAPAEHPIFDRLTRFGSEPRRKGAAFFCLCPKCLSQGHNRPAKFECDADPSLVGHFSCNDCGCSTAEFLRILGLNDVTATHCPRLLMADNIIPHTIFDAVTRSLVHSGRVFQSFSRLLFVLPDKEAVHRVRPGDIISLVSRHLVFYKVDRQLGEFRCKIPLPIIQKYLSQTPAPSIPRLAAVVNHPLIEPDGTPAFRNGFDPKTELFHLYDQNAYQPKMWTMLSSADARKSAQLLEDLFAEFPFKGECDKSAALAATITALLRPMLENSPLIAVSANEAGTGKTTLCHAFAVLANGQVPSVTTFPKDESEAARTIFSKLLECSGIISFDNVSQALVDYPSLCACLTSPKFSSRTIRSSYSGTASTKSLFTLNGNNLIIQGDLRRRTLLIHLEAPSDAVERVFKTPYFMKQLKANLVDYQVAALKIAAAYLQSKDPSPTTRCLVGFNEWSRYCREPLMWLGYADPLTRTFAICKSLADMGTGRRPEEEFLQLLANTYKEKGFFATDVIHYALDNRASETGAKLYSLLTRMGCVVEGKINDRTVGLRLTRCCEISMDGRSLVKSLRKGCSFYSFRLDEVVE